MSSYLHEIETKLKQTAVHDPDYKAFREKTSKLTVLGHRLPLLQKITKDGFSFSTKTPDEILKIWDDIWQHSSIHEAMYQPLFYYRNHQASIGKKEWGVMKHWIDRIENWEHSDTLSYLYSILYEKFPVLVEPTFRIWNRSKNPWKQRASIVSLIYYASSKRKAPPVQIVLKLVEPLIKSRDKYVAKAVGWTLRESYNLYPTETLAFITTHVRDLAPDSFSYATEKLSKKEKLGLKRLR
mgnify:CR=1 FL=1